MLRRTLRTGAIVAVTATILLASTGCIRFTLNTTINLDGSGSRTIETVLDRSMSDLIKLTGKESAAAFERQLRAALPRDAALRTFRKNGETYYVAGFEFASVAALGKIVRGRGTSPSAPMAKLKTSDNPLLKTYEYTEYLPPLRQPLTPEESKLTRDVSIRYRLTMPGTIVSADADEFEGGSTAVWSVPLDKGRTIRASSRVVNWIAIGGGVAAIAVVVIVMLIIIRIVGKLRSQDD